MMWQGIDHRKFPRVSYKCRIKVNSADDGEVIEAITENVGAGGICVVQDRSFSLFEKVSLEMHLDGDNLPILCDGTIVWIVKQHPVSAADCVKYDTGIEFLDISDENRERICTRIEAVIG